MRFLTLHKNFNKIINSRRKSGVFIKLWVKEKDQTLQKMQFSVNSRKGAPVLSLVFCISKRFCIFAFFWDPRPQTEIRGKIKKLERKQFSARIFFDAILSLKPDFQSSSDASAKLIWKEKNSFGCFDNFDFALYLMRLYEENLSCL